MKKKKVLLFSLGLFASTMLLTSCDQFNFYNNLVEDGTSSQNEGKIIISANLPIVTDYKEGDISFKYETGCNTFTVTYSDDTIEGFSIDEVTLPKFDKEVGDHVARIQIKSYEYYFYYTVHEAYSTITLGSKTDDAFKYEYYETDYRVDDLYLDVELNYVGLDDSTNIRVAVRKDMIETPFNSAQGSHSATIDYQGEKISFDYFVKENPASVATPVATPYVKERYFVNEFETEYNYNATDFEIGNSKLNLTYSDGHTESIKITKNMIHDKFDSTAGWHVTYIKCGDESISITYHVKARPATIFEFDTKYKILFDNFNSSFIISATDPYTTFIPTIKEEYKDLFLGFYYEKSDGTPDFRKPFKGYDASVYRQVVIPAFKEEISGVYNKQGQLIKTWSDLKRNYPNTFPDEHTIKNPYSWYKTDLSFDSCTLVVDKSITTISESAFYNSELKSIKFLGELESIGKKAFANCPKLTDVEIPNVTSYIGEDLFSESDNIQYTVAKGNSYIGNKENPYLILVKGSDTAYSFYVHDDCKALASCAYKDSTALTSVDFTNYDFECIGDNLFDSCTSLKNVNVGNLEEIPSGLFNNCTSLVEVVGLSNVKIIGDSAFEKCTSLESADLKNAVEVRYSAFSHCDSLKSVTLGDKLKSIGRFGFYECNQLVLGRLPFSLESVEQNAFKGCDFEHIYKTEKDGCTYVGNYSSVGKYNPYFMLISATLEEGQTEIRVQDGCKIIYFNAFFDIADVIESVYLPKTLIFIGDFNWCKSNTESELKNVYYEGTMDEYLNIGFEHFLNDGYFYLDGNPATKAEHFYTLGSNGEYQEVSEIHIPEGEKDIDRHKYCGYPNVKTVYLPSTLEKIKYFSCDEIYYNGTIEDWIKAEFDKPGMWTIKKLYVKDEEGNYQLFTELHLNNDMIINPGSLRYVAIDSLYISADYKFDKEVFDCDVKNVYYEGTLEDWMNLSFDSYAKTPMSRDSHFFLRDENNNWKELTELVIPEGTTSINPYNFYDFTHITKIVLPSTLKTIGSHAFYGCSSVEELVLPEGLEYVLDDSLNEMKSLKNIVIPSSIKEFKTNLNYNFRLCPDLVMTVYENGYYVGNQDNPYLVLVECVDSTKSSITIHSDCKFIAGAFDRDYSYANEKKAYIKEVRVPEGIIGIYKSFSTTSLEKIIINGKNLKYISGFFHSGTEKSAYFECDRSDMTTSYSGFKGNAYYYSEEKPSNTYGYWHYVDGVITLWK